MNNHEKSRVGHYVLLKVLGTGGFAHVFLGEHIYLKRLAAIKMISAHLQVTEQENFLEEAQHIARLEHPNIIRVLDFGVDKNIPYLVMSYAPNGTLYARHKEQKVPLITVVNYVKQIAAALQHAHNQQLIHRDVKPLNLLVGAQQEILLSDFGIALLAQSFRKPIDASGTLTYMAPEQLDGRPCFASDQYALGIIAYQWLSGLPPFHGSHQEIYTAHLFTPPPPLRARVPGLSVQIEQVILKALAKRPQNRFDTIHDFAAALETASRYTQVDPHAPTILPIVPGQPGHNYQPLIGVHVPLPLKKETQQAAVLQPPPARARILASPSQPVPEKEKTYLYQGHTGWVTAVAWSPDGAYLASASWDETVQVWSPWEQKKIFAHHGHTQPVKAVAWSPDGAYLASASWDETVQVWHVGTMQLAYALGPLGSQIETVQWSSDGRHLAAADHKGQAHVWNKQGQHIIDYAGHIGAIWSLAWSPDSAHIATASYDGTIQIWNAMTGERMLTYQKHYAWVSAVAWSTTQIASAAHNGVVHIWDAQQGETCCIYNGHNQAVKALAWSPSGTYIASGERDVQVWHAHTGACLITNKAQNGWINAVAWSPDERYLATGSDNQTVLVWEVGNLP